MPSPFGRPGPERPQRGRPTVVQTRCRAHRTNRSRRRSIGLPTPRDSADKEKNMFIGIIVLAAAASVGIVGSVVSVARDGYRAIPTRTFTRWS
jgi:hypothetical protein